MQRARLRVESTKADIVISNVTLPDQSAPTLITKTIVDKMKAGSVTVDLVAGAGGNVETTVVDDAIVTRNEVTCIGYTNMAGRTGVLASDTYSSSIASFLLSMGPSSGVLAALCFLHH